MEVFRIQGPTVLNGEAEVQGSKNAVLPMMAAAVINSSVTVLENCPDISDVRDACEILSIIGCKVQFENGVLTIDSGGPINSYIPDDAMKKFRASFIFTGAILARCKHFTVSQPGGCNIGMRPVDIHLDAMRLLGAKVQLGAAEISCSCENLTPCDISLRFPSVGATENIMILASALGGTTRIINAAREPEICDLQKLLNLMGARITGAGSSVVVINGTDSLSGARHTIMPDRIDTATYLSAVCCNSGKITVKNADPSHVSRYINILKRCGADICVLGDTICVEKRQRLTGGMCITTAPYPGFPTDMQSLLMSVLTTSRGVSLIKENIFENRFCVSNSLVNMGADIRIYRSTVSVRGVRSLRASSECVCDLRSGAALALAMFGAEGTSELKNIHYIDRGYEKFEEKYARLGALIERIELTDVG